MAAERCDDQERLMTQWARKFLSPEWVFRVAMFAGMGALLWLNAHYVTQAEYRAERKEMASTLDRFENTMSDVRMSIERLKWMVETIADHETRIRALERVKTPHTP
jgi:C4-dicarboxylate-specific signal transduction histidine kinase